MDIVIERKLPDYFVVHDSGKSLAELFIQGITLTESRRKHLESIAKSYGAELVRDVFKVGCKQAGLENAILSVALCATMAMLELIGHQPEIEEEPISARIGRTLKSWQPPFIHSVDRRVLVKGNRFPHYFDFVTFASDEAAHHTAAIKVLPPSYGGQIQAERYAFLVLDIERTHYDHWSRFAIITKAETWPTSSIKMIAGLSKRTLELKTGEEHVVEEVLPGYMNEMVA
ncbi:MAG: hypothetical protein HY508_12825 [Acidobacteria bacterium]|nr:hypothetical protein [Acidobacteriota bacterium]